MSHFTQHRMAAQPIRASDPHAGGNGPAQPGRNAGATSTSTPVVNQNDHVAAAAYLMNHFGATGLVVLDSQGPPPSRHDHESRYRPGAAAGEDLNDLRIRDPKPAAKERARKATAIRRGSPASPTTARGALTVEEYARVAGEELGVLEVRAMVGVRVQDELGVGEELLQDVGVDRRDHDVVAAVNDQDGKTRPLRWA